MLPIANHKNLSLQNSNIASNNYSSSIYALVSSEHDYI